MSHSSTDLYQPDNLIKIMRNVENMGKLKHGYYSEAVEKISSELRGLRKEMKKTQKKRNS